MKTNGLITLIPGHKLRFTYTNWKGRRDENRRCILESISYGVAPGYHEDPQWFLNGLDLDKKARRSYALKDMEADTLEIL